MAEGDGLVAAFSEYAVSKWDAENWRSFGRGSDTVDILDGHPRLYRSLGFGDDDYADCVWDIVPKLLRDGAGPSIQEKMTLVADFVPELVTWVESEATHRTRKRFIALIKYAQNQLPPEWAADAESLLRSSVASTVPQRHIPLPSPQLQTNNYPTENATSPSAPPLAFDSQIAGPDQRKPPIMEPPKNIFIVHGHDHGAVNEVKVLVHRLTGIMPEILADQPGQGDTIIEKFERHASTSDYAIVLLTPDDEGRIAGTDDRLRPRARQNVILELGYFFGKLGRDKVAVINKGVEQPSDVHGLSYIRYGSPTWIEELRHELKAARFAILT